MLKQLYIDPQNANDEWAAREWIDKLLDECNDEQTKLSRNFMTVIPSSELPFYSRLSPFYSTSLIKPDVTVVTKDTTPFLVVTSVKPGSKQLKKQ